MCFGPRSASPEISDDGVRVNTLDYLGLQHAALKAVDRRVARLEMAKPVGRGRTPAAAKAATRAR